jgi:hypothetical protein
MPMIEPMLASSTLLSTRSSTQRAVSTAMANSNRSCASAKGTASETGKSSARPAQTRFSGSQSKKPRPEDFPVRPCSTSVRSTAIPGWSSVEPALAASSLIFSGRVSVTSSRRVSGPAGNPACSAARSTLMGGSPSASSAAPSSTRVPNTRLVKNPRLSWTTIGVLPICRTTS